MKTKAEIEQAIKDTKQLYEYVLKGSHATIQVDAPRALLQLEAETTLKTLYWVVGEQYKSKLKGIDK